MCRVQPLTKVVCFALFITCALFDLALKTAGRLNAKHETAPQSSENVEKCSPLFYTGMNQLNHMALPNGQMSQSPMGAQAASPMNHPQQVYLSSVPAVRAQGGEGHTKIWLNCEK